MTFEVGQLVNLPCRVIEARSGEDGRESIALESVLVDEDGHALRIDTVPQLAEEIKPQPSPTPPVPQLAKTVTEQPAATTAPDLTKPIV